MKDSNEGCRVVEETHGENTVMVYRFGNETPLDPVVLASEMDTLSGWNWFGIKGRLVFYRTGEKAISDDAIEYVMFAAAVTDISGESERSLLEDEIHGIFMRMSLSLANQRKKSVFGAVVEPLPKEIEMIEDAVYELNFG